MRPELSAAPSACKTPEVTVIHLLAGMVRPSANTTVPWVEPDPIVTPPPKLLPLLVKVTVAPVAGFNCKSPVQVTVPAKVAAVDPEAGETVMVLAPERVPA